MGTISDCCVSDDNTRLRNDNEGSNNMDTRPTQPLLKQHERSQSDTNFNPSIYTKQDINTNGINSNITSITKTTSDEYGYINSGEEQVNNNPPKRKVIIKRKKIKSSKINLSAEPIKQSLSNIPSNHEDVSNEESPRGHLSKGNSKFRIVITEPLSPKTKLMSHPSFETDDHPYSKHKRRQKLLTNGYIRRYNITSYVLSKKLINLIFKFYYFHYADKDSQLSILNNISKQERSMALITSELEYEEDLSQFLDTILKSKLGEKMWTKFDRDLKGVVETDKFNQFLILPVILYKSTLHHRQVKERQNSNGRANNGPISRPNLDKKAIKSDAEHLAIWIIRNYGERQRDNSYHFVLSKEVYQNRMAEMVRRYIDEYTIFYEEEEEEEYEEHADDYQTDQEIGTSTSFHEYNESHEVP